MLAAVIDSQTSSASKPAATSVVEWQRDAPAWQGATLEVDAHGGTVMTNRYGPYDTGKLTLRYHLATDHLTVAGSPHSFRYGHNSGPFPFSEAQDTLQQIADALLLPPEAFKLHRLETGITVPTSDAPTAFLAQLARAHYGKGQTPFYATEPPSKCSEPLLFAARTNELRVKVYNSGAFAKFKNRPLPPGPSGQGFRFELQYLKSRRLGKALGWDGSLTWANLMQADVYEKLANRLLESWHSIFLPAPMDTPHLSIDERALLIAGQYPEFWEVGKRETPPATYRRKRTLFLKLQKAQAEQAQTATPYTAELERNIAATLPAAQK